MKKNDLALVSKKVNYTRTDVLNYVEKVRNKFIKDIQDEYQKKYEGAFRSLISNDPDLWGLLEESMILADKLKSVVTRIESIISVDWKLIRSWSSPAFERYKSIDVPLDIKDHCYDATGILQGIREEENQKIEELKDQYKALNFNLRAMTTPLKMRKYLDSLGFDTSYFDTEATTNLCVIEPQKLFPVNSQKLLEG